MKKTITSSFLVVLVLSLLVPSVTFAAWWNPFTWEIFSIFKKPQITFTQEIPKNVNQPNNIETEVEQPKTEAEKSKPEAIKQKENKSVVAQNALTDTELKKQKKELADAKEELRKADEELRKLKEKNAKNQIISSQEIKSRAPEIQKPPTFQIPPPSFDQLSNFRRFCLGSKELQSICAKPEVMPGYYSNIVFRNEIDKMVATYLAFLSSQQRQKIAAEKATLNCIMAPTPQDETTLDPATQNYLRQIRCGTVTTSDKTNYELSRIKSSVDELKYRLESKISWPSLFLDPIKTPTFDTTKWQVRWEGSGGRVTNSNGSSYQFYCEDNMCRSY